MEETWRKSHGGVVMEEESWMRSHGRGIIEEAWKRNHKGVMEEESWMRNYGEGIVEEDSWVRRKHRGGAMEGESCRGH